jgi:hypothetical protein
MRLEQKKIHEKWFIGFRSEELELEMEFRTS